MATSQNVTAEELRGNIEVGQDDVEIVCENEYANGVVTSLNNECLTLDCLGDVTLYFDANEMELFGESYSVEEVVY